MENESMVMEKSKPRRRRHVHRWAYDPRTMNKSQFHETGKIDLFCLGCQCIKEVFTRNAPCIIYSKEIDEENVSAYLTIESWQMVDKEKTKWLNGYYPKRRKVTQLVLLK